MNPTKQPEKHIEKLAEEYFRKEDQKRIDDINYKGQRVGMPISSKEVYAKMEGFKDGLRYKASLPPARPSENDQEITVKDFEEAIEASRESGAHTGHTFSVITKKAAKACYDLAQKMIAKRGAPMKATDKVGKEVSSDWGAPIEIDWKAIEKDYKEAFAGILNDDVFNWFKSRPEFQSQSPTGKFSEADMRKCFEAAREYETETESPFEVYETFDDYLLSLDENKSENKL